MPVKIDGSFLLPAPLVSFEKNYSIAGDGTVVGATYNITLEGQLLQNKGNPTVNASGSVSTFSGAGWTSTFSPDDDPLHGVGVQDLLASTIAKEERIRELFAEGSGVKVEIVGFNDQTKGIRFYGIINSLTFSSEGRWALPTSYSVSMTANNFIDSANTGLFPNNSTEDEFIYYVDNVSESWGVSESDLATLSINDVTEVKKVYNVTHSLNVQGKVAYDSSGNRTLSPWQQASGYVHNVLGVGSGNFPAGILDPIRSQGFALGNRQWSENIDVKGGSYSIDENFILFDSGVFPSGYLGLETVTIDLSEDTSTNKKRASIRGTIDGINSLSPTNVYKNNYLNASGYLDYLLVNEASGIWERVKKTSGYGWVNQKPLSKSISHDFKNGQISYTFDYDNRFPTIIPESIFEEVSISDTYPGQLFSVVPVIGGSQPVIQYLNSRSEYKRSLSINVVMPVAQNWSNNDVNVSGLLTTATSGTVYNWFVTKKPSLTQQSAFRMIYDAANPANDSGVIRTKVFHSAPVENWNPTTGSFSYNIEWVYNRE